MHLISENDNVNIAPCILRKNDDLTRLETPKNFRTVFRVPRSIFLVPRLGSI
jgi:hypothetical protein